MKKIKILTRITFLLIISVAISGCFKDEPSPNDINESFQEAYEFSPEMIESVNILNLIPHEENTMFVDFEWTLATNADKKVIQLNREKRIKQLEADELMNKRHDIFTYIRENNLSPEEKEKATEDADKLINPYHSINGDIKDIDYTIYIVFGKSEMNQYHIKVKNMLYFFNENNINDDTTNVLNNSLLRMLKASRDANQLDAPAFKERLRSKALMIKTKNGWRFYNTSVLI